MLNAAADEAVDRRRDQQKMPQKCFSKLLKCENLLVFFDFYD